MISSILNKTLLGLIGLSVLTTCLITSCKTGPKWEWEADWFLPDYTTQDIGNSDSSVIVKCNQKEFNDYACLHYDKLEELERNIERIKDKYQSLLGFHRSILKSQIKSKKDKGENTSELEAFLNITEQEFKIK